MEGATPLLAAALQGHTKVAGWIGADSSKCAQLVTSSIKP